MENYRTSLRSELEPESWSLPISSKHCAYTHSHTVSTVPALDSTPHSPTCLRTNHQFCTKMGLIPNRAPSHENYLFHVSTMPGGMRCVTGMVGIGVYKACCMVWLALSRGLWHVYRAPVNLGNASNYLVHQHAQSVLTLRGQIWLPQLFWNGCKAKLRSFGLCSTSCQESERPGYCIRLIRLIEFEGTGCGAWVLTSGAVVPDLWGCAG